MYKDKIYRYILTKIQVFTWIYMVYALTNYNISKPFIQFLMVITLVVTNVISQNKIYESIHIGFSMPVYLGMLFIFRDDVLFVPVVVYLVSEAIQRAITKKEPIKLYLFNISVKMFRYIVCALLFNSLYKYTNNVPIITIKLVVVYAILNITTLHMTLSLRGINFFKIFNPRWLVLYYVLESYFTIIVVSLYFSTLSLIGFYGAFAISIFIFNILNKSIAIERHQSTFNETLEYFVDYFNYGIMILDKRKIILSINNHFKINKMNVKKLVGSSYEDFRESIPLFREVEKGLDKVSKSNSFYETNVTDHDKSYSITVISTDNNNNKKYVILIKDITKEYSERINYLNEQRLASLEELAAGTANDIKNPLAVANGFLQLIKAKLTDSQLLNYTDEALKAIEATDGHIELFTLLGNGAKNHHKHKKVNLSKILESLLKQYESTNVQKIKFTKQIDENVIAIGDEVLLTKAFKFLLLNAMEAVSNERNKLITVKLSQDTCCVTLDIIDNGVGISEENILKIYDPYYTTKKNNTHGLGLFYTKKILNHHNGKIKLSSKKGKGTEVKVQIEK